MYLALLAVQYLPTGDAFFFTAAASALMAVVLLCGWLWAVLSLVAVGLLAFASLGPALIWPFFLAYGLWVFIKMAIEWLCFTKGYSLAIDYALKTLAAVLLAVLARFTMAEWLLGQAFATLRMRLGNFVELWPLLLVVLILLYDYVLTLAKRILVKDLFPHMK